jgi:hypothetical protein
LPKSDFSCLCQKNQVTETIGPFCAMIWSLQQKGGFVSRFAESEIKKLITTKARKN